MNQQNILFTFGKKYLNKYYSSAGKFFKSLCILIIACTNNLYAQHLNKTVFTIIPLGVYGGLNESNLSSYLVGVKNSNKYVCLDAGTLHYGLQQAVKAKLFSANAETVLKNNVAGYLISHPHLDHVAGLIINSPNDSAKNIYALPFCIDVLKDKYFSWKSWANFGDEGEKPLLKKYHYVYLNEDSEMILSNTGMYVTAFELSHSNPYKSTAFLVRHDSAYVLYLGDTGADSIEQSNKLSLLWQHIAPLIQTAKLKGIFIETSFPDEQPVKALFGHLTPSLLMNEMQKLARITGIKNLQHIPVFITHIKPSGNNETLIKTELNKLNTLHLHFIFPQQAHAIEL